jgi:Lon protease-like protein
MTRRLPLFPLQLVVFPGATVPLHIFEERYKEMVGNAEATESEFGIVRAITRGEENGIASIGCTVKVDSVVTRYPDGRFDVITRGVRRFRIVSVDDEQPCLWGSVEYFDDEHAEPIAGDLLKRALVAHERLRLATGDDAAQPPEQTQHAFSFQLAEAIDDLDFRSLLLQSRSEPERLKVFTNFVDEYIARHRYIAHMKKKAPTNGAGHKRPAV